jgi:polar amino acid transport system substrate-binding protein
VLAPGGVQSQVELLRTGKVDVYGSNVNNLLLVQERLPGSEFVPGAFLTVHFAVAMPRARSAKAQERLAMIVEELSASGVVRDAIGRAGLMGVSAAP